MSDRRVVVTGLGIVSPVGNDVQTAWHHVVEGISGIGPITHFDASQFATHIGGEVKDFDPLCYLPPKDLRKSDLFIQYGIAAGTDAFRDSGLADAPMDPTRIGVFVGSGIGGLTTIDHAVIMCHEAGPRKVSPFLVSGSIINMVSGKLSILHNLKGPNVACAGACATATQCIGLATRIIQYGDADAMLAGGAEVTVTPSALGSFCSARAISRRNDDPTHASRPWDRDRDGFVMADGAGVVLLEEYAHARARGARIYGEIAGFGMSCDAYHVTAPSRGGEGAALCMRNALHDAGVNPAEVQYINAHGTSTPAGDLAEVEAVKAVFGEHAYKLAMSSTKSVTGHMTGAAGGVEAIFTLLAMRDHVLPPTVNLDAPGDGCDLDFVPNTARTGVVDVALSNSFGFGGTNATLVLKRP
ncbi:MAG TPA: beta-ketoacyl-ACP synthase II [Rhodanobacteraceae bacterium]